MTWLRSVIRSMRSGNNDRNTEVDFVAEKQGVYTYVQVTADMTAEETFTREMQPLTLIHDNYEKIILTTDRLTLGNYNGIHVKNLVDWLLGGRGVKSNPAPSAARPAGRLTHNKSTCTRTAIAVVLYRCFFLVGERCLSSVRGPCRIFVTRSGTCDTVPAANPGRTAPFHQRNC